MFVLAATASLAPTLKKGTSFLKSYNMKYLSTTTIKLMNMKHEKDEPKSWTKILPQTWREKMNDKSKPKISVLNLHGAIANTKGSFGNKSLNITSLEKLIDKAFAAKKLEAVFLSINSPGGSAVQSELIAEYISQKSKKKQVPVISFVEDIAASGGYWLATAAPTVYVSQSSIVGSIGVISQSFGLQEAIAKLGIERRTQTMGKYKDFINPFKAQSEEEKAIITNILSALYENFKNHVKSSRGDKLKGPDSKLFTGEIWVGQQAVDLGLVDGIDTIHKFIEREFGSDKVTIQRITKMGKLDSLFGSSIYSDELPGLPFVTTAFAHQVAEAFLKEQSPFDGIKR